MRFDALHRGVTLMVVLAGSASLFLSGEFGVGLVLPATLAPLAGLWTWRVFARKRLAQAAGVLAAVAGAGALWMALASEDYLYWAIVQAVFLASLKSWMLRKSEDFLQMYVLSFLEVMAAAVVNPGLSFGVLMLPYTVLLTLSLMLTNLRRGIEAQATGIPGTGGAGEAIRLRAALARRDLVRPAFLTVTVAVTTAVVLASFVFFLFFPRLGFGFFARQARRGMAVTGFSETVKLGDFGNIAEDPEVVLRIRMRTGGSGLPMRMRGQSLDQYDGSTWRKTTQRRRPMTQDADGRFRVDANTARLEVPDVQVQEVYLEPMLGTPRVLFGMPMPAAYERPPDALEALRPQHWRFFRDESGDVSLTGPENVSIVYTAYSDPRPRDPNLLRAAGDDYPEEVRRLYLGLPPQKAGIAELARQVAGGRTNPYEVAGAVEGWLKSSVFEYSLDSTHGDEDPLADFLLVNRSGHCEYFASAMVVMLRTLGIPARIVNGFYGGTRNQYGDYVALRRADAHSWVEAFFPGQGWATFDPTPASALDLRSGRGWWQDARDAVDAVKLAWYRWVVEYNLEKQVQFLASLLKLGRSRDGAAFGEEGLSFGDAREMGRQLKAWPWRTIGGSILGTLAAAGLAAWALRRRRRRVPGAGDPDLPEVRAYRRMRRLLRRHGFVRGRSETQLEFAARVGQARPEAADGVLRLTWAYLRAVSGEGQGAAVGEGEVKALERALATRPGGRNARVREP